MKKIIVAMLVVITFFTVCFSGCNNTNNNQSTTATYSVTFNLNGGTGTAPSLADQKENATFTIPTSNITRTGYTFSGWEYGGVIYQAGDTFVMPASDVSFSAQWANAVQNVLFNLNGGKGTIPSLGDINKGDTFNIPTATIEKPYHLFAGWQYNGKIYQPGDVFVVTAVPTTFVAVWIESTLAFSQINYVYDRIGKGNLELPFYLYAGDIGYLEVNGELLSDDDWYFDYNKDCIVINENYVMALDYGDYVVRAIIGGDQGPATCVLTVTNSVKTYFDNVTVKTLDVYKSTGITFTLERNGVDVVSLKQGNTVIDSKYYTLGTNSITIKSELVKKYVNSVNFTVSLANSDSYTFTVKNNVIFYTDYDVTTIHDTKQSNTGLNSLYQYSDNVSIVSSPASDNTKMSGNVLKFTPNIQEVTYSCHGIYTISAKAGESALSCWYKAGLVPEYDYFFSFDYYVDGLTGNGLLEFRQEGYGWCDNLKYGGSNNKVVHHYERLVSGNNIGRGVILWAFFNGASTRGNIYVDNFSIIAVPKV